MPTESRTHKVAASVPGLDRYFAAVRDENPFASNRVTEPSPYDVDVASIHSDAFDRLVALAAEAMQARTGLGVALLGGAGIGKSHLLSRLYRWAAETGPAGGPKACYVYLHNIMADPDRLPRYLLKYVVSRLSKGGQGPLCQTPLFGFLDRAIRHALGASGIIVDRIEDQLQLAVDAYLSHFVRSAEARTTYVTLLQFWRFARPDRADDPRRRLLAGAALAWLSGDEVDPGLAAQLGLADDEQQPVMLADDEQVKGVLHSLAELARVSQQPLVLCIDQFENLDPEKVTPFCRFLHAMLDRVSNLLVITCGVKQTLLAYRDDFIIPEAAWDRIADRVVELHRLKRSEARQILEARLERFHDPFLDVDPIRLRIQADTLFPLGRNWLERKCEQGIEFKARQVLNWARDAWEDRRRAMVEVGGINWIERWTESTGESKVIEPTPDVDALIDAAIDRKIEEHVAQLRLQAGSLPPDAGNLAGLVESLLACCKSDGLPYTFRGLDRLNKRNGRLPAFDLMVRERRNSDGREVRTGVTFVTNIGKSASASMRRMLEAEPNPDHRMLATDEERRPLKVGAQGAEYYRELERLGTGKFEHLKLDFEQYARLDALQNVIGMARSGDLEIEAPRGTIQSVSEAEVVASHHRRDRFREHPLLRPLLTEEPPVPLRVVSPSIPFDESRVRQYIMAQLAWRMGSTAEALARGFAEATSEPKPEVVAVWKAFKEIGGRMHAEGLIHATPHDTDLFLLLRK